MRYVENGFGNGKKLISILLLILIFCGVIGGIYLMWYHSNWDFIHTNFITQGFVEETSSKTLLNVFLNALSWTSYTLILIYLCGYSAIGHPVSLLLILMRGIALGISVCTLYLNYNSKGILIFISMVMVHAIASTMVLVFATITSLTQSTMIACTILGRSSDLIMLKKYNIKFLLYAIIVILSSVVDTVLTYVFYDTLLLTS